MVEIKSIEQLLYFMKGHIHLSRYDEKFIENISTLNTVTTNQVVLLHNLIGKYQRQLAKHELFSEKLVDLPWNITVVESSPKYTNGHLSIENGMIYFKCPFSRKFIDEFRKEPYNQFIFNKDHRRYEAPYNQYSLKILLKVANNYFNSINLCPVAEKLLENLRTYHGAKYWSPTLVNLNNRLYLVGMNSSLNDALGDIELNTDLQTLSKLVSYGITIDECLYNKEILSEYICANYFATVEISVMKDVVDTLHDLKCDMVYLSGAGSLNINKRTVVEMLTAKNIPYIDTNVAVDSNTSSYNFPVNIRLRKNAYDTNSHKVCKVIHVVNSLPIEIK